MHRYFLAFRYNTTSFFNILFYIIVLLLQTKNSYCLFIIISVLLSLVLFKSSNRNLNEKHPKTLQVMYRFFNKLVPMRSACNFGMCVPKVRLFFFFSLKLNIWTLIIILKLGVNMLFKIIFIPIFPQQKIFSMLFCLFLCSG